METIAVSVLPDFSRFRREYRTGLAREAGASRTNVRVGVDRASLTKAAKTIASTLGKAAVVTAKTVAVATAAAGAATGKLLADSVKSASDLGETMSKTGVLFGSNTKLVEAFAAKAATAMGQSRQSVLDGAATFAIYGKQAQLSAKNLVPFSTGLTSLASDMASFSNTSPQEAIEAIGSAMRGEMDPIEKYGVLLNESALKSIALRKGLIKTTKDALTPQQRVLAVQAALYEQLGDKGSKTIGDFARTSGGLANQQRTLKANWENMKTEVGNGLLPVVTRFTTQLNTTVIPAFQKMWQTHGPKVVDFLSRMGDKLTGFLTRLADGSLLERAKGFFEQIRGGIGGGAGIGAIFDKLKGIDLPNLIKVVGQVALLAGIFKAAKIATQHPLLTIFGLLAVKYPAETASVLSGIADAVGKVIKWAVDHPVATGTILALLAAYKGIKGGGGLLTFALGGDPGGGLLKSIATIMDARATRAYRAKVIALLGAIARNTAAGGLGGGADVDVDGPDRDRKKRGARRGIRGIFSRGAPATPVAGPQAGTRLPGGATVRPTAAGAGKPGLLSRAGSSLKANLSPKNLVKGGVAGLAASVLAPPLIEAVLGETKEGTWKGAVAGGLQGALTGASVGAFLGPMGAAAGGAIGGLIGAIDGADWEKPILNGIKSAGTTAWNFLTGKDEPPKASAPPPVQQQLREREAKTLATLNDQIKLNTANVKANDRTSANASASLTQYVGARKQNVQAAYLSVKATQGEAAATALLAAENDKSRYSLQQTLVAMGWTEQAARDYATEVFGATSAAQGNIGANAAQRQSLQETIGKYGIANTQAGTYSKTVVDIPDDSTTNVHVKGDDAAKERLKQVNDALDVYDGTRDAKLTISDPSNVGRQLLNLLSQQAALRNGTSPGSEYLKLVGAKNNLPTGAARGGLIGGFSPNKLADNIPAMLTAKEFVQPVDAVEYYGVDFMEAVRRRRLPKFAEGGAVGWPFPVNVAKTQIPDPPIQDGAYTGAIPRGIGNVAGINARSMAAAIDIHNKFPWARVTSGLRHTLTRSGHPSLHNSGRATDWAPHNMTLFNYMHDTYPSAAELIYSPAGGRQIWKGRPHYYSGGVRADHWDHIHLALARGGLATKLPVRKYDRGGRGAAGIPPGVSVAVNGTRRYETVRTAQQEAALAANGTAMRLDRRDLVLLAAYINRGASGQPITMDGRQVAEVVRGYDYLPRGI